MTNPDHKFPEWWLVLSAFLIAALVMGSMFWAIWFTANQQRECDDMYGPQWDSYGWDMCVETDMGVEK